MLKYFNILAFSLLLCLAMAAASGCGGKKAVPPAPSAVVSPAAETGQPATEPTAQPTAAAVAPLAAPAQDTASAKKPASTNPIPVAPSAPPPQAAPPPSASDPTTGGTAQKRKIGELVFFTGSVAIHRKGAVIQGKDIEIGDVVHPYDILLTGPKSKAEIDIASGASGGATVKLSENTAFYFDSRELDAGGRKTTLQLLSGSIALKVEKLSGGSFTVGTDTAILGVRGTTFVVDTVPDGAMLVSCVEGAVAVRDSASREEIAQPGTVITENGGTLAKESVPAASLGSFRMDWRTDAYAAFGNKALSFTSTYAAALDKALPDFYSAYTRLQSQEEILALWRAARSEGRAPRFTDYIAEKKAVAGVLFDCLAQLFKVERLQYRLIELHALHASGIGSGTLKDGRKSGAYFKSFETSSDRLVPAMADVREALGLFTWASAGSPVGNGGIFLSADE